MDMKTAEILCNVTSDFYRAQAASFSATRTSPWHGWRRCVTAMAEALGVADCVTGGISHGEAASDDGAGDAGLRPNVSVFDLACGNLRFERYLAGVLPCANVRVHAVDGCDELAADVGIPAIPVTYESSDIVGGLIAGAPLSELHRAPQVDMAVSFGFLHHVPGEEPRVRVLDGLIDAVRPGGCVAVSLWQFMNNPALAAKAHAAHAQASKALGLAADAFDEGDYLLGWKNVEGAWRYCHHFSDGEVSRLIDAVSPRARLVDAFEADGRTGAMNKYLVFKRRES